MVSLFEINQGWPAFRRDRAFLRGFVAGAGYFGGTVYWTGTVVSQFGGLSWPVGVIVAALLVGYLALFPGLFAIGLGWTGAKLGVGRALLLAPAIWVSTELARTYFWSGFPWVLLGYSQTTVLPVAQLASVIGVFGLSALVASVSATAAYFAISRSPVAIAWVAGVVGVVLGVVVVGERAAGAKRDRRRRYRESETASRGARAGEHPAGSEVGRRAGGKHSQYVSRNDPRGSGPGRRSRHLARVVDAVSVSRMIVWRESTSDRSCASAVSSCCWEAIRSITRLVAYYNSAFLVQRDGAVGGIYQKMHLVPFGEFVPLQRLLFFVGPLVETSWRLHAGRRPGNAADGTRADQHGDLLRDCVSSPCGGVGRLAAAGC